MVLKKHKAPSKIACHNSNTLSSRSTEKCRKATPSHNETVNKTQQAAISHWAYFRSGVLVEIGFSQKTIRRNITRQ